MRKISGRTVSTCLFGAFLILAGILHIADHYVPLERPYGSALCFCAYSGIYFGLILFWAISVRQRLLPSRAKQYMLAAAFFMLEFQVTRITKYRIAPRESLATRYCWYLYYPSVVMIPTLFLMTCVSYARARSANRAPDERLLTIPAAALILGVFTNDAHHLALIPTSDRFFGEVGTYAYGPLYYAVAAWDALCMVGGVVLLIHATRRIHDWKKAVWPLMFLAALPVMLWVRDLTDARGFPHFYQVPEIVSFCMLGVFEACIRCRLVPHNENYAGFFASMDLPAVVADKTLAPVYRTAGPVDADEAQLKASLSGPVYPREGVRLSGMAIRGGYTFWTEDERELRRVNSRLQEANEALALENDLIRSENELRERRERVESRNRLYGRIAERLYPTQKKIGTLLDQTPPGEPGFRHAIALCCVMNAYVKRRSNLMLLSDRDGAADNRELILALEESARYLKYCGIDAAVTGSAKTNHSLSVLCALYDAFEAIVEALLPCASRLAVSLTEEGLRLMTDGDESFALPETGLPVDMKRSEDVLHIAVRAGEVEEA